MRKSLLTAPALVALGAGGAAAEPVTVSLGGFANFYGVYVDEDPWSADVLINGVNTGRLKAHYDNHVFATDTELHVFVTGKADNGLSYGATIEFEADAGNPNNVDEVWTHLFGDWGRIELGSADGAGDQLEIFAPTGFTASGGAADGNWEVFNWSTASGQVMYSTGKIWDTSDATKLTYLTPEFAGFRAGVSYAPQGTENFIDGGTLLDVRSPGDGPSQSSFAPDGPTKTGGRDDYHHYWEAGAGYAGIHAGIEVNASVVYTRGEVYHDDPLMSVNAIQAGLQLGYGGVVVGGGYGNNFKSGLIRTDCGAAANGCDNGTAWTVGIQYDHGPWVVGANYLDSEFEGDTGDPDNDRVRVLALGGQYNLAPGLAAWLEIDFMDIDSEYTGGSYAVTATTTLANYRGDNDGTIVMLGTALSF